MKQDKQLLAEQMRFAAIAGLRPINDFGASYLLEDEEADGGDGDVAKNIRASMEAPITEKDAVVNYNLIIVDKQSVGNSKTMPVKSSNPNMTEVLVDELIHLFQVPAAEEEGERAYYLKNIEVGNNLVALESDQDSFILVKA